MNPDVVYVSNYLNDKAGNEFKPTLKVMGTSLSPKKITRGIQKTLSKMWTSSAFYTEMMTTAPRQISPIYWELILTNTITDQQEH